MGLKELVNKRPYHGGWTQPWNISSFERNWRNKIEEFLVEFAKIVRSKEASLPRETSNKICFLITLCFWSFSIAAATLCRKV